MQGFDAAGELVCVDPRTVGRSQLALCGSSAYDVENFVPAGFGLTVSLTCTPTNKTQALLVTQDGVPNLDAAVLQSYLENGGIVITAQGSSFGVYNAVFDSAFAQVGGQLGMCLGNVGPFSQMSAGDPFWADNGPFTAEFDTGCGYNLAPLPDITPLGRHDLFPVTAVNLAYIDKGEGRLWLVESDWMNDAPTFNALSRKLMRYMVGNK